MSRSLEALERISNHKCYEKECSCWDYISTLYKNEIQTIKKDLERLEQLEKENRELKELQELNKQGLWNLKQENQKLKKAIDCIQAFPIDMKNNEVIYELLKEVLENE